MCLNHQQNQKFPPAPNSGWSWAVTFVSLLCLLLAMLGATGCVERRLTIRSDPPAAQVLLDGKTAGQSPTSVPFDFYGTREITIHKKGYVIFSRFQPISPPWYQIFPLDFFFEFCCPFTLVDEQLVECTLTPYYPFSAQEREALEKRAQALRAKAMGK